jgi:hypothetical protein
MASTYSSPAIFFLGTAAGCFVPVAQALPYHTFFGASRAVDGNASSTPTDITNPSSTSPFRSNTSTNSFLSAAEAGDSPSDLDNQIPGLVAASVLFFVFIVLVVCVYFFGAGLRRRVDAPSERKELVGLGFGFDGFTKAELKALRLKEQLIKEESNEKSEQLFVRLPERPPALALRQDIPLPPIDIQMNEKHEDLEADITQKPCTYT